MVTMLVLEDDSDSRANFGFSIVMADANGNRVDSASLIDDQSLANQSLRVDLNDARGDLDADLAEGD